MGYYTRYSLTWNNGSEALNAAVALFSSEDALRADGGSNGSVKWYNNEADMKAFSLKFPTVLFTLSGKGEESGDVWNKYFLDGKVQVAKAKLDIAEFNAKLLV